MNENKADEILNTAAVNDAIPELINVIEPYIGEDVDVTVIGQELYEYIRIILMRYSTTPPEEQMITAAVVDLKELQKSLDPEGAHSDADDVLLRFVPEEVKDEWEKVDKWYA